MPWFKVDDSFYDHPKVWDAPDCAVALWVRAGSWSARNLQDGFVPARMPARFCDDPEKAVRELLERGLWRRTKGGFLFHDWDRYQPTREEAIATRDKKSSGGRIGNHRRWHEARGVVDPDCEFCQGKHSSDNRSLSDRYTDSGSESAPNPPVPSRPVPSVHSSQSSSLPLRNAREDDDLNRKIEQTIINVLAEETRRTVTPDWATKVRRQILDGRDVTKPISYVTRALRERPRDFLPTAGSQPNLGPPVDPLAGMPEPPPLGQRDNPANGPGLAATRAALAASKQPKGGGQL
jgi:hypothetical protein